MQAGTLLPQKHSNIWIRRMPLCQSASKIKSHYQESILKSLYHQMSANWGSTRRRLQKDLGVLRTFWQNMNTKFVGRNVRILKWLRRHIMINMAAVARKRVWKIRRGRIAKHRSMYKCFKVTVMLATAKKYKPRNLKQMNFPRFLSTKFNLKFKFPNRTNHRRIDSLTSSDILISYIKNNLFLRNNYHY